jgi:hypothetical protein
MPLWPPDHATIQSTILLAIDAACARSTTATNACNGYVVVAVRQWVFAMLAYVKSEGRLFGLNPSEWSMLLGGVILCGLLTLLLTA